MKRGFVDSSVLVAIAFEEPGAQDLRSRLAAFEELLVSPLLEAELASALAREETDGANATHLVEALRFLHPPGRLTLEIEAALQAGALRGAGLFQVASALFASPKAEMVFLSLDAKQREVASRLGFEVAP